METIRGWLRISPRRSGYEPESVRAHEDFVEACFIAGMGAVFGVAILLIMLLR